MATLGFSRASFVRFSEYEKQEDWLRGIEEALQYFGGVPKELLFDNAKCIMTEPVMPTVRASIAGMPSSWKWLKITVLNSEHAVLIEREQRAKSDVLIAT